MVYIYILTDYMDHPESNGANPGSIGACVVELWGGYIFGGGPVCSFATVYGTIGLNFISG